MVRCMSMVMDNDAFCRDMGISTATVLVPCMTCNEYVKAYGVFAADAYWFICSECDEHTRVS